MLARLWRNWYSLIDGAGWPLESTRHGPLSASQRLFRKAQWLRQHPPQGIHCRHTLRPESAHSRAPHSMLPCLSQGNRTPCPPWKEAAEETQTLWDCHHLICSRSLPLSCR